MLPVWLRASPIFPTLSLRSIIPFPCSMTLHGSLVLTEASLDSLVWYYQDCKMGLFSIFLNAFPATFPNHSILQLYQVTSTSSISSTSTVQVLAHTGLSPILSPLALPVIAQVSVPQESSPRYAPF